MLSFQQLPISGERKSINAYYVKLRITTIERRSLLKYYTYSDVFNARLNRNAQNTHLNKNLTVIPLHGVEVIRLRSSVELSPLLTRDVTLNK
ncbi:MAG: hypothetical protein QW398_04975 [Desulfurococcaceae archaeon]